MEECSNGTPLVPSWLKSNEEDSNSDKKYLDPKSSVDETRPSDEKQPENKIVLPIDVSPSKIKMNRFQTPRTHFTKWVKSDGSNRRELSSALSNYISSSLGGSKNAARRMSVSTQGAARLTSFLISSSKVGLRAALREINLEFLVGKSFEETLIGLVDYVCPEGSSIDQGIARSTFLDVICNLNIQGQEGIDLNSLTVDQIAIILQKYVIKTIMARILNDIGTKTISLSSDIQVIAKLEDSLSNYLSGCVKDAFVELNFREGCLNSENLNSLFEEIYMKAFDLLKAMAEEGI